MHAGSHFKLLEAIVWTRRDLYTFLILSTIPTAAYQLLGFTWLAIPWVPIALIGTAVAFLIGFKNNATYDRLWEARRIWGGIVNASRAWGLMARDFVTNRHANDPLPNPELLVIHRRLIYRHLAWLTALRFQLRVPRVWETMNKAYNLEYRRFFSVQELEEKVEDHLEGFLSAEEKAYVLTKQNRATQILGLQSRELRDLQALGLIEDFRHMELQEMLNECLALQGQCERIKNFPYPRQFATLNRYFVCLFILLLPFGLLQEFEKLGSHGAWLTIPFSVLVSWVFMTMERIGEATENPFQGGANDVPITSMSRTIEIDLRDMLDESELPEPVAARNHILM